MTPRSVSLLTAIACCLSMPAMADDACRPSAEAAKVQEQLDAIDASCQGDACRERKKALLDDALARLPEDVVLHRAYQDLFRPGAQSDPKDPLPERYRKLLDTHAGQASFLYLYGRVLLERQPEESLGLFRRAFDVDPRFPWTYLGLVYFGMRGAHQDEAAAKTHMDAFVDLCPETTDVYSYALNTSDSGFNRRSAERLRALIERHTDPRSLDLYGQLWAVEFRLTPPDKHEALRARVRADLEHIEGLRLEQRVEWWRIRQQGWELAGDAARKHAVEEGMIPRFPCTYEVVKLRQERWDKGHPRPASGSDAVHAYDKAYYDQMAAQVRQCPDDAMTWWDALTGALELPELPATEVERLADGFLRTRQATKTFSVVTSPYFDVARAYLGWNVRLEQVEAVVRLGLDEAEAQFQRRSAADIPERMKAMARDARDLSEWESLTLTGRAEARLGHKEAARETLTRLISFVEAHAPGADADERARTGHRRFDAGRRQLEAELATAEGRRADAWAFYRSAATLDPSNLELKAARDKLWRELGGTEDGLKAIGAETGPRAVDAPTGWKATQRPLPEFDLVDLAGRRWSRRDLEGRTALVSVWATWCGPCVSELPHLQKLHERLAPGKDVVLLTLNVDFNPGLAAPFVKEQGLTFPVLLARDYFEKAAPDQGIPQVWIVDANGIVRQESLGLGGDGEAWAREVTQRLESLATGR